MTSIARKLPLKSETLPEFGKVRLLRDVVFYGTRFPEGSTGTVVEIHDGGAAYEVEFSTPAEEVVGVRREDLLAV
jgi:hypothetical protein